MRAFIQLNSSMREFDFAKCVLSLCVIPKMSTQQNYYAYVRIMHNTNPDEENIKTHTYAYLKKNKYADELNCVLWRGQKPSAYANLRVHI